LSLAWKLFAELPVSDLTRLPPALVARYLEAKR